MGSMNTCGVHACMCEGPSVRVWAEWCWRVGVCLTVQRVTFWQEAQGRAGAGSLQPPGDLLTEDRSLFLKSKGIFQV